MTKPSKTPGTDVAPGKAADAGDSLARFNKAAAVFVSRHTRTKAAALAQLRKAGIVTKGGKLTKAFGG